MVKKQHTVTSIVLTLLLVMGMLIVGSVNVSTTAKAAGGDVIYFAKPASWGTPYCYVWGGNAGEARQWPGE